MNRKVSKKSLMANGAPKTCHEKVKERGDIEVKGSEVKIKMEMWNVKWWCDDVELELEPINQSQKLILTNQMIHDSLNTTAFDGDSWKLECTSEDYQYDTVSMRKKVLFCALMTRMVYTVPICGLIHQVGLRSLGSAAQILIVGLYQCRVEARQMSRLRVPFKA